jgi:hypothetical protein
MPGGNIDLASFFAGGKPSTLRLIASQRWRSGARVRGLETMRQFDMEEKVLT